MRRGILFLSILSIFLWSFQQVQLKKIKISDAISAELPESFRQVSEQELNEQYALGRQPLALYRGPHREVEFSVNVSSNQWQYFDLPLVKDFYKANLSALYSDIKMLNEGSKEVNGHPTAFFEYIGTVEGEESVIRNTTGLSKYTYVSYALVNGKVVVFTFTAPARQQQQWAAVAEEIMHSFKIKKTL